MFIAPNFIFDAELIIKYFPFLNTSRSRRERIERKVHTRNIRLFCSFLTRFLHNLMVDALRLLPSYTTVTCRLHYVFSAVTLLRQANMP